MEGNHRGLNQWGEWEQSSNNSNNPSSSSSSGVGGIPSLPPPIKDGSRVGMGCDHWDRYKEHIDLMADQLGVNAYRFSIEWAKVQPEPNVWDQDAISRKTK